jgi:hypothetical protein
LTDAGPEVVRATVDITRPSDVVFTLNIEHLKQGSGNCIPFYRIAADQVGAIFGANGSLADTIFGGAHLTATLPAPPIGPFTVVVQGFSSSTCNVQVQRAYLTLMVLAN